jgi:hypothetical protein
MQDEHYKALAHERRRALLLVLHDGEGPVRFDLAASDGGFDGFITEMYHNHLPVLRAADLVSWDAETGEVRCGERFDELRPVLEAIVEHEDDPATLPARDSVFEERA